MSVRRFIIAPQRKPPLDPLYDLPLQHSQERPWKAFRKRPQQRWFSPPPLDLLVDLPLQHSQERPWHAIKRKPQQRWFNPHKPRFLHPPYCSHAGMLAGVANGTAGTWHVPGEAGQLCCEG